MANNTEPGAISRAVNWTGRIMSLLPSLLLIMSAVMKLTKAPQVVEGLGKSGFPESVLIPLGITELACVVLYLIPWTSVLGAILLTGYLGGAIATHVRLEENFVFIVILGMLVWGGLWLRDRRIRSLIPLRFGR